MATVEDGGWRFTQCFGDKGDSEDITEGAPSSAGLDDCLADIISAVEFDSSGDFLATGDRGGRVVLFERNKDKKGCEYKFYTEFQSHEPEFDYLKSLEIEEKINKIKWCKRTGGSHFLLTTNDKTIKLWKIYEKTLRVVAESCPTPTTTASLRLPKLAASETFIAASPKRIFANAHAYHINSISVNCDGETYLSADDLRINLWNMNYNDQSFNIVDVKPQNMEELTEVITAAEFHPSHCNLFMYSSSKGSIKMVDMRQNALCDQHAKIFEEEEDATNKSFFTEILSSINDIKFSPDGRYILSRDYLTLKIWDINMESKPVKTIQVHDYIQSKVCDLYENECLFDKFECAFSGDGKYAFGGSYSNYFHLFDRTSPKNEQITLQADKSVFRSKRAPNTPKPKLSLTRSKSKKDEINPDNIDFAKKILHASWHPHENSLAIAATNNLFIFSTV